MNFDKETKVWSGAPKIHLHNPSISMGAVILGILKKNPSKIAQISDNNGLKFTNKEIWLKSVQVAQELQNLGLKKDDVIGVIAKNHHYVAPVVFAALSIGTPINPIAPTSFPSEIAHILQMTKPKLIFCDDDNITRVREGMNKINIDVPIFVFGQKVDGARQVEELFKETGTEKAFIPVDIIDGTKHTAAILCSSGTTGLPKGVAISHATFLFQFIDLLEMTQDDVILSFSTLYWYSGFASLILGTLAGSLRIITTSDFTPELALRILEQYKVSVFLTPPSSLALILQSDALATANFSALTKYLCLGSMVAEELANRINALLLNGSLYNGYGMTEVGFVTLISKSDKKPGSVGRILAGHKAKIIDDNNGTPCENGVDGEIYIKAPFPFISYYGNPDAYKTAINENGWNISGDIGHFDADGYLYLVDRKKDIMKYKNWQISPSEIESVIAKHRGVTNVSVVPVPDLVATDLPAAMIIKNNKFDVTEDEIKQLVASELSDAKNLRGGVYFVDSLPMTASGKIIRREVTKTAVELYTLRQKS